MGPKTVPLEAIAALPPQELDVVDPGEGLIQFAGEVDGFMRVPIPMDLAQEISLRPGDAVVVIVRRAED